MGFLKKLICSLIFCFSLSFSFGQDCSNIFEIAESPIFGSSGLSFSFNGKVANDGFLYFRGSVDGSKLSIWKTDGTAAGTTMIIEETNNFGRNWDNFHIVEDGVFIQNDDDWLFIADGDNQITMLPEFEQRDLKLISGGVDGVYYLAGEGPQDIDAIEYDTNNNTTKLIPAVLESTFNVDIYAGEFGVLFEEKLYLKATDELLTVPDYLATLGFSANGYNNGSIFGKYMYASFNIGFSNNFIINMETNEVIVTDAIQGDIIHLEHNNLIYFIGQPGVIKFDTVLSEAGLIYNNRDIFSDVIIFDDQLIVGTSDGVIAELVSIDTNTDVVTILPEGTLGSSFQNSKFLVFENEFYYVAEVNNENQSLLRYDFQMEQPVLINVLSELPGGVTEHVLEEVQGRLVTSTRFDNGQHELAFCADGTVNVVNQSGSSLLSVFPSPAIDHLQFSDFDFNNQEVLIYNTVGSTSSKKTIDNNGILNVADLIDGLYFGTIFLDGEYQSFKFIKH